jgi:enoyl-CoA hydratase
MPPNQLMDAAMGFAREIASKSPIATVLAKHVLNTIEDMSLRDGYRFEQNMTAEIGKYEDSKESMSGFAEKRPPFFAEH